MNYPLNLSFKILAIASQFSVTDATGNLVAYVKRKAFKLKEDITVFADKEQTKPLYSIKADRVIDFRARYQFATSDGQPLGSIKRQGARSIWSAHYDIEDTNGAIVMSIKELNPWAKVMDALLGEVPIVGMFTGYMFHPKYGITRTSDNVMVLQLEKQPAFLEGKFQADKLAEMTEDEERLGLLGIMMMITLERIRG